jgi:hypothetical protein
MRALHDSANPVRNQRVWLFSRFGLEMCSIHILTDFLQKKLINIYFVRHNGRHLKLWFAVLISINYQYYDS